MTIKEWKLVVHQTCEAMDPKWCLGYFKISSNSNYAFGASSDTYLRQGNLNPNDLAVLQADLAALCGDLSVSQDATLYDPTSLTVPGASEIIELEGFSLPLTEVFTLFYAFPASFRGEAGHNQKLRDDLNTLIAKYRTLPKEGCAFGVFCGKLPPNPACCVGHGGPDRSWCSGGGDFIYAYAGCGEMICADQSVDSNCTHSADDVPPSP